MRFKQANTVDVNMDHDSIEEMDMQMGLFGEEKPINPDERPSLKKKKLTVLNVNDHKITVDVDLIDNHPMNKKIYTQDEVMFDLKKSILKYGLFDSGIDCKKGDLGRYTLLSGHRRLQAYRELISESLISKQPIIINLKEFETQEDEIAYLINMNKTSRERGELDKLNEIFFTSSSLKSRNEQISNQEIVQNLTKDFNLGESQLKKYMRLFEYANWDHTEINNIVSKYKTVNQWDDVRKNTNEGFSSKDKIIKKNQKTENYSYYLKDAPSKKTSDLIEQSFKSVEKAKKSLYELNQRKELSSEGSKQLKSLLKSVEKLLTNINHFLINEK